jgi:hypothetical protein
MEQAIRRIAHRADLPSLNRAVAHSRIRAVVTTPPEQIGVPTEKSICGAGASIGSGSKAVQPQIDMRSRTRDALRGSNALHEYYGGNLQWSRAAGMMMGRHAATVMPRRGRSGDVGRRLLEWRQCDRLTAM